MADVHREVELKYAADDAFEVPSLTQLVADAVGASLPDGVPLSDGLAAEHRLEAVYFDTPDLRLAAAGLTLRRRTGGDDAGWHLKVPAGRATRSEIRLPPGRVPPGRTPRAVPEQLQSMVWAQTLGRPLQPVARITTQRTLRRVSDPTGLVLVEVADDRVTAQRLGTLDGTGETVFPPTHWREIEVELSDAITSNGNGAGLVDALDARLRQEGLRTGASSKLAQVLDGAGPEARGGRGADAGRELTARSTAGEVVLAHIREQVAQVRAQDLPVRLDAPDAVHKMRVATRRLRSALKTFSRLFDRDVARPLRKRAGARAGTTLPPLVARTYDRVRDLVREAEARPDGAEREELWHDARKAAKQSRYAGESVAPVFGQDATAFAAAMEDVQEALGEHQDSVLTRERLRELALDAPSTEVAFLYGRLHAQEEVRTAASHEHVVAAWQAAGRKRLHRWLRAG